MQDLLLFDLKKPENYQLFFFMFRETISFKSFHINNNLFSVNTNYNNYT